MADVTSLPTAPVSRAILWQRLRLAVALALIGVIGLAVFQLESRFRGLDVSHTLVGDTPVTYYRPATPDPLPLVIVAHGFGGSRQMMDQISVSVARAGFHVAAFDFPGHGRNPVPMSRDVTSIEGTTRQLVEATRAVTAAMRARPDILGPVSFIGHSMATDVTIRAAAETPQSGPVIAVSMYSEAVTPDFPRNLLIVSGAFEGHLRAVALDTLRQIAPNAEEGSTATEGATTRRAVVAPGVGHVGVLYSDATLAEITTFLRAATGQGRGASLDLSGVWAGVLLASLVLLAWPAASLLPQAAGSPVQLPRRAFWLSSLAPIVPAALAAWITPDIPGVAAAFPALAAAFAVWGLVQLAVLARFGLRPVRPDVIGSLALAAWGLGIFALALDRYGAAFLPGGTRIFPMLVLLIGAMPAMMADAHLTQGAPWWQRLIARAALILTLASAMMLAPAKLGISFTVLPVLVLFFVVYGSFARWVAQRRGPGGAWPANALALAWALAASTPLFAV